MSSHGEELCLAVVLTELHAESLSALDLGDLENENLDFKLTPKWDETLESVGSGNR